MKKLGALTLIQVDNKDLHLSNNITPPKITDQTREKIRKSDRAKARIERKASSILMG